ncbi:aspartate/glutamate racemase family protein [Okibacterium endophyticum]
MSTARAGLLHTVPALAGSFHTDITATRPDVELVHIADPVLLQTAVDTGVTDAVHSAVRAHVAHLAASGAMAVLVTCSSIGEAVEAAAATASVPVIRVDAAMADEAVRLGRNGTGRILVLATLEATLGPTTRLIERAAGDDQTRIEAHVVRGAAAARSSGDRAEHNRLIAQAILEPGAEADVVVLAQATMVDAVAGQRVSTPVLTSPSGGIAALLRALDNTMGTTHDDAERAR